MAKDFADELIESIGGLKEAIDTVKKQGVIIDAKLSDMMKSDVRMESSTKAAHKRLDILEPIVKDHEAYKNKGLGIISFVSFVCTVLGAFIGFVLHKMGLI